jgi:hypothetical protein
MLAPVWTGRSYKRLTLSLLAILFYSVGAFAQNGGPTRTQCKQWDDSYLFLFNLFLLAGLALPLSVNLILPPLFGQWVWGLTAPRMRIFFTSLIVAFILTIIFVGLPFVAGFGAFVFSGIDQSYFNCETLKFGATGLIFGLIGAGLAAISQWVAVLILLVVSCALGGLLALIISEILVALIGLGSRVRGGNS